ncbi:hypothetical protein CVH13_00200, partial [Dehalococcoides mccartyi]
YKCPALSRTSRILILKETGEGWSLPERKNLGVLHSLFLLVSGSLMQMNENSFQAIIIS